MNLLQPGDYAAAVVDTLLPVGKKIRSVVDLRTRARRLIERDIVEAMVAQQAAAFPDIGTERAKLAAERARLEDQDQALRRGRAIDERIEEHRKKVLASCLGVMTALENYLAWIDKGEGGVDNQRRLWAALRSAWDSYKSLRG